MNQNKLIAIVGGIGSGKSVVSEILRILGYSVYDCDSRAKSIMDSDVNNHQHLCTEIHPLAVVDGKIDRPLISKIVFSDSAALARLNAIVHSSVRADLLNWRENESLVSDKPCFVETAIFRKSRMDAIVDGVWEVEAPLEVRIERVMKRNGLNREQILSRINAQSDESLRDIPHKTLNNSGDVALLPQVHRLLNEL